MINPDIIGGVAGVCTSLSLLPQLVKLIKDKRANDISLFYLALLFTGLSAWIIYGVLKDDKPVIITNVVSVIINAVVMVLSIYYKRKADG